MSRLLLPRWSKLAALLTVTVSPFILVVYVRWRNSRRDELRYKLWEEGVVYLYQPRRSPTVPSCSHTALTVETWLRCHKIEYQTIYTALPLLTTPMRVRVELNGRVLDGDLDELARALRRYTGVDVDEEDGDGQPRVVHHAVQRMAEHSILRYSPLFRPISIDRSAFHHELAADSAMCLAWLRCTRVVDTFMECMAARIGAHRMRARLIDETGTVTSSSTGVLDDLRALVHLLGAKAFFHGDRPGKTDCVVFGVLAPIVYVSVPSTVRVYIQSRAPTLREWLDRCKVVLWPDFD